MKKQLINDNGSIGVLRWRSRGKEYRFSSSRSVGRMVLDCIDTVYCVDDGTYTEYTRRKLTGVAVEVVEVVQDIKRR